MTAMKIKLLLIGKTDAAYLEEGMTEYVRRIRRFVDFEVIADKKNRKWNALPPDIRIEKEADIILKHIRECDHSVLLDERGKTMSSVQFAQFIDQRMKHATRSLLFVVGGPWGFSKRVYQAAHSRLSMSAMTFSHQMIRLFFAEQLYRAFTIIRGEAYHNE